VANQKLRKSSNYDLIMANPTFLSCDMISQRNAGRFGGFMSPMSDEIGDALLLRLPH
jgi:hypothetical protein